MTQCNDSVKATARTRASSLAVVARVSALNNTDYGECLELLRQRVDPFVQSGAKVETIYTVPVAYQARARPKDLFRSYLTAFVLVAIVMMVVLRRLPGLLVMLPNLFQLLLFGMMGWLDFPVDIGSVMTASVALGIAVDDTLHFLLERHPPAGLLWTRSDAVFRTAVRQ